MILRIQYLGRMVYLAVDDTTLIFDGVQFNFSKNVDKIALGPLPPSSPVGSSPQNVYPVQSPQSTVSMRFEPQWVCTILERGDTPPAGITPIVLLDNIIENPVNGEEICLVTCRGTDIQYVQVIPAI